MEQPPGKEDGGDGVEVDPVGGDDGTELANDPVPEEEAEHGGDNAQEEQIEENGIIKELKNGRAGLCWETNIIRNNGDETVYEHLAGDEGGGILIGSRFHQQRVDGPAETGAEGQQVAEGREVEHEMTVEHDDGHA